MATPSFVPGVLARIREGTLACVEWPGRLHEDGYGRTKDKERTRMAHRFIYERLVGPISKGLQLDHLCRNRACCNPAHLEPVTARVNILRSSSFIVDHIRKTHCPEGHSYDVFENGKRRCRTCIRRVALRNWHKRAAAKRSKDTHDVRRTTGTAI